MSNNRLCFCQVGEKLSLDDILKKGTFDAMRGPALKFYNDTLDGGKSSCLSTLSCVGQGYVYCSSQGCLQRKGMRVAHWQNTWLRLQLLRFESRHPANIVQKVKNLRAESEPSLNLGQKQLEKSIVLIMQAWHASILKNVMKINF